jgi:hypothetical protein
LIQVIDKNHTQKAQKSTNKVDRSIFYTLPLYYTQKITFCCCKTKDYHPKTSITGFLFQNSK